MTPILVKLFIKNHEQVQEPQVRTAYGNLAGLVGILCNLLLFLGKFVVGTLFGSIAIAADAVNNLSDASSNIVSLVGFKLASKPADEEHPYGHARFEYLAGLVVAIMVLVIGFELGQTSLDRILHPKPVVFSWLSVAVLACSIGVKLWMARFNATLGRLIDSAALKATAADSRNDVLSTGGVLIASLLSHWFRLELDGWIGLAVALFILYSGIGLIRDTLDPLLGQAPDPELVHKIHDRIMSYPGVLGTHDLIVHDYGPGRQFASVHVEMAAEADVMESHDVIDSIEHDFWQQDRIHVVIHFDPIITTGHKVGDTRVWLAQLVAGIDPRLTIHDLRMVPGPTHTNLIFDCAMPPSMEMEEGELKKRINQAVHAQHPSYYCVITVDKSFASIPR